MNKKQYTCQYFLHLGETGYLTSDTGSMVQARYRQQKVTACLHLLLF
jgi:hypothetical protein